jgi:hypothetical protein
MKRPHALVAFGSLLTLLIAFNGCYKGTDFINPVYDCACGTVSFNGTDYPLKMAEAVVPDSLEPLSRSYHIVADLRTADEVDAHAEAHDLTFHFSFPILDDVVYYVQQEDIQHLVQVINHGDDLIPIRDYQATDGSIVINPAYSGGEEVVEFNLTVRERVDSILVGLPVTFTGSFTGIID